jgi:hypothetical protein
MATEAEKIVLLRSANRRIAAASEWAKEAKLLNVAAELRQASKEISEALQ